MNEDKIIQTFFTKQPLGLSVALGIGDDAALLDVLEGYQVVVSTDTLLEGRHFPNNYPPEKIASRAVGVCVSDLAAMGAVPKWATLALTIPDTDHQWLESFSTALHAGLADYSMSLIGGDTVKGPRAITLTVLGIVESGQALRRDSALIEDDIYVSGNLGAAAFTIYNILAEKEVDNTVATKFHHPKARIDLGRALIGHANSCMDISDGVLLDLSRLIASSNLGAVINLEAIPCHPSIQTIEFSARLKLASGGDDYELLFTAPKEKRETIKALSEQYKIPLTIIGNITQEHGLRTLYNNKPIDLKVLGYQHF